MRTIPATLALAVLLAGCAVHAVHPGAANKFDSDSYDAVLVTHNLIETTKTDLANNAFPAAIAGNVKTALNDLIKAYDIADTAYTTFHQAALAGTSTPAQQAALTNDLAALNTQTAALTAAKASK